VIAVHWPAFAQLGHAVSVQNLLYRAIDMAVDFFLNLLLGDVVKVRHDGVWLGRVWYVVMWRGYGFLGTLDCILRFKKEFGITDETCKMEDTN
jgi:hypothetical protein